MLAGSGMADATAIGAPTTPVLPLAPEISAAKKSPPCPHPRARNHHRLSHVGIRCRYNLQSHLGLLLRNLWDGTLWNRHGNRPRRGRGSSQRDTEGGRGLC